MLAWIARRAEIVADAERILGPIPEDAPLGVSLRSAEAGASQQLTQLTEQRARLTERVAALEGSLERLRTSEGECPVCRRPLDARAVPTPRRHTNTTRMWRPQSSKPSMLTRSFPWRAPYAGSSSVPKRSAMPHPRQRVNQPTSTHLSTRLDEAKAAFETALGDARQAELVAADSTARRNELEAQQTPSPRWRYTREWPPWKRPGRRWRAPSPKVLEAQLGPVSDEVNRRWEAVFPDRPGLRLDSTGQMARTFDDDEEEIDFRSFSSGEKVVAKLLLRLATLTSTTEVPFCWIDEPLEHLDPDARSYVAQTLAYLSSADALTQIVVTTYEQDLALQLADGAHEQVRLEFLKTAPVASQ